MATYGVIGSPTYAVAINDLGLMLNVLPDNSSNLISAQDVRDVVAGLYENIDSVSVSVASVSTASVTYVNLNPTSIELGGVPFNTTFSTTVQSVFDQLFYPYTPPVLTLVSSPNVLEFGNTTSVTLNWSITAGINDVQSAIILRPADSNQPVSYPVAYGFTSSVLSSNNVIPNTLSIFTFSVNDLNTSVTPNTGGDNFLTASVSFSLRRYWGTLSSGSLLTVSSASFSHSDISSLSSELSSDYSQSRLIGTNNDYVVFVWPHNQVNLQSIPAKVSINGLPNNDWTNTRDGVVFTNQFGYTASYDVWRFNNIQGAFTSSYVIST